MFARSAFFLLVTLGFGSLAALFSFIGIATLQAIFGSRAAIIVTTTRT